MDIPIAPQFSVCRANNLSICLFFLEPCFSKLAPFRYTRDLRGWLDVSSRAPRRKSGVLAAWPQ
jgi:hypothetical protein